MHAGVFVFVMKRRIEMVLALEYSSNDINNKVEKIRHSVIGFPRLIEQPKIQHFNYIK